MAIYNYKCNNCCYIGSITKPMKEAKREEKCPLCNEIMQRVFDATANQWKCSGAYVTDNK